MASVKRIYALALAKIFETVGNDTDYDTYSPLLLDSLLVEALPYENAIRCAAGQAELTHAPELDSITTDTLDWDDRICRMALPYGLAAVLLSDDESRKAESVLNRNEFLQALEDCAPATFETPSGWEAMDDGT